MHGATLEGNEADLLEAFLPVQDPRERLALIVDACAGHGLEESGRLEPDLVRECVSRVWLRGEIRDGRFCLGWDAESPLVRGLAGLVCRVYQHTEIAAAVDHRSRIIRVLELDRLLSPSRLRGLAAVESRIHAIGES